MFVEVLPWLARTGSHGEIYRGSWGRYLSSIYAFNVVRIMWSGGSFGALTRWTDHEGPADPLNENYSVDLQDL